MTNTDKEQLERLAEYTEAHFPIPDVLQQANEQFNKLFKQENDE